MMQLTEEQRKALAEKCRDAIKQIEHLEDVAALDACECLRIALSTLEAAPVAYVIKDSSDRAVKGSGRLSWHSTGAYSQEDINEYEVSSEPLYSAPPVASLKLPDELFCAQRADRLYDNGKVAGWNACLAEVRRLNAATPGEKQND